MNFTVFPVGGTNIFPIANSTTGGQLLTEFNLRSRESIETSPNIKYMNGHSFTHSEDDWRINGSETTLTITEGRGVINGHYVETLVPIEIDIANANAKLIADSMPPLVGKLKVGIRAMYSTEETIAGSLKAEGSNLDYFEGIQVVILTENEFFLPEDKPNNADEVTAHIYLGQLHYENGTINEHSIKNNRDKVRFLHASRLIGAQEELSDEYITKTGLNKGRLYVFSAGKGEIGEGVIDSTWCGAEDSLMVWDHQPQLTTKSSVIISKEAAFSSTSDGVALIVPHKQIEGLVDTNNNALVFPDKILNLPNADYDSGKPGVVNKAYTDRIKQISKRINELHLLPNGTIREVINDLYYVDEVSKNRDLPDIVTCNYAEGDYVVVINDHTVSSTGYANGTYPSTMYIVVPGSEDPSVKKYSDPVYLTGQIPLAEPELIGGFLNVSDGSEFLDQGYIIRDDNGHLKLLDYALIRSGTLAYQLGEDFESPAGISGEEIQINLDEYVNNRVAFANSRHMVNGEFKEVINVTLKISNEATEENPITLNIENIDSRFNTCVYLHILGEANQYTTINIRNCEKLRIDDAIGGQPIINLYGCCLYYDGNMLDRLNEIQDLSLWYRKFDENDPEIVVDEMTVSETNAPITTDNIDYWSNNSTNDYHYRVGLNSITFDKYGQVIRCGILINNSTTQNVTMNPAITLKPFELPQGSGLSYPKSRITKELHFTGSFITAYPSVSAESQSAYVVLRSDFTAVTGTYNPENQKVNPGTISIFTTPYEVTEVIGEREQDDVQIAGIRYDEYHMFYGGAIY